MQAPLSLKPIKWIVVSDKNINDLAALVKNGRNTYVALTWQDYLSLGQNMQQIMVYIKSDRVLLCYYRKDLNEAKCKDVPPPDPASLPQPATESSQ